MKIIIDKKGRTLRAIRTVQARLNNTGSVEEATQAVQRIITDVRTKGDTAIADYTNRFHNTRLTPKDLKVTPDAFEAATKNTSPAFRRAIRRSITRVRRFQTAIKPKDRVVLKEPGMTIKVRYAPIAKVGLYIPGGKAIYPSSVVMTAVPAQVAGVKEIVIITPPGKNGDISPEVLYTARAVGVTAIYKTGGAMAIAALAYGTTAIPKVDKIFGPGNMYVNLAKEMVSHAVGIDGFAGPSEIVILADGKAPAKAVAADLISQVEHNPGLAVLITTSQETARRVAKEVDKQTASAKQRNLKAGMKRNSITVVVPSISRGVELANAIAPEHIEICTNNPARVAKDITQAGAVYVGADSPVPMGDYMAGPSHVLPTSGTARHSSVLSVFDFMLQRNEITGSKKALQSLAPDVRILAKTEGLPAHYGTFEARLS